MPSERSRYLHLHAIRARVAPKPLTRDELRGRLDAMPHARLVDVVMDLLDADHELLVRARRVVVAQDNVTDAAMELRAEIDRTLAVHYVPWDAVDAFVMELDAVVGEIRALARTDAKAALDVALYFLDALPRVFDSIHGEDELGVFAEDFAQVILSMAINTDTPFETIAEKLLRAAADDGYGYFGQLPEVVRRACTTPEMEQAVLRAAEHVVRGSDGTGSHVVEALVRVMRAAGT
jgi:hypothetical protein